MQQMVNLLPPYYLLTHIIITSCISFIDRVDSLEERQKNFFANCTKNKFKSSENEEYEGIRKEYQKVSLNIVTCNQSVEGPLSNVS